MVAFVFEGVGRVILYSTFFGVESVVCAAFYKLYFYVSFSARKVPDLLLLLVQANTILLHNTEQCQYLTLRVPNIFLKQLLFSKNPVGLTTWHKVLYLPVFPFRFELRCRVVRVYLKCVSAYDALKPIAFVELFPADG